MLDWVLFNCHRQPHLPPGAFTIETLSHLWEGIFVSSHVRLIQLLELTRLVYQKRKPTQALPATLVALHERSHNNTKLPLVHAFNWFASESSGFLTRCWFPVGSSQVNFMTSNKSKFAWNSNKREPQCGERTSYGGRNLNCKRERISRHHSSYSPMLILVYCAHLTSRRTNRSTSGG